MSNEPKKCGVCNEENDPTYKCPTCYLPYCGVACCKIHKEICEQDTLRKKRSEDTPDPPQKKQRRGSGGNKQFSGHSRRQQNSPSSSRGMKRGSSQGPPNLGKVAVLIQK